jgi:hypothetical protein
MFESEASCPGAFGRAALGGISRTDWRGKTACGAEGRTHPRVRYSAASEPLLPTKKSHAPALAPRATQCIACVPMHASERADLAGNPLRARQLNTSVVPASLRSVDEQRLPRSLGRSFIRPRIAWAAAKLRADHQKMRRPRPNQEPNGGCLRPACVRGCRGCRPKSGVVRRRLATHGKATQGKATLRVGITARETRTSSAAAGHTPRENRRGPSVLAWRLGRSLAARPRVASVMLDFAVTGVHPDAFSVLVRRAGDHAEARGATHLAATLDRTAIVSARAKLEATPRRLTLQVAALVLDSDGLDRRDHPRRVRGWDLASRSRGTCKRGLTRRQVKCGARALAKRHWWVVGLRRGISASASRHEEQDCHG